MSDSHQHAEVRALPESRLWLAFGLTGTYMVAEIIGGLVTGSLALISDAMHMMTDAIALLLALIAIRAGRKAADLLRTYGYARFEILAAAVNALVLLGVAFYILYEAYRRLSAPQDIQSLGMMVVAIGGLIINLVSMRLLASAKDDSLNVKGAYLEVWADMLGSVAVIVGAIIIWLTGWRWVDSALAVAIGFMVFPRLGAAARMRQPAGGCAGGHEPGRGARRNRGRGRRGDGPRPASVGHYAKPAHADGARGACRRRGRRKACRRAIRYATAAYDGTDLQAHTTCRWMARHDDSVRKRDGF